MINDGVFRVQLSAIRFSVDIKRVSKNTKTNL